MPKQSGAGEWDRFRNLLLTLRARLKKDIQQLGNAALHPTDEGIGSSRVPTHPADHGSETYDQEFDLILLESEGETLAQIDAALERIREGQYGTCGACGKNIPKRRLEVIPYTAYCVDCADQNSSKSRRIAE